VVEGARVELRDPEGRLLVRYENGAAEIVVPSGDLTLRAPEGRVVIQSGKDIELCAGRDLSQRAARDVTIGAGDEPSAPQLRVGSAETSLNAARLEVQTEDSRVTTGQATVIARRIATTASVLTQSVERFELVATRLFERTRDAFRDATNLSETRAGRARTLIKDVYALYSRRTTMNSTEDTAIDGDKILLG